MNFIDLRYGNSYIKTPFAYRKGVYRDLFPAKRKPQLLFSKESRCQMEPKQQCWYIPCTEQNYELLAKSLKGVAMLEVAKDLLGHFSIKTTEKYLHVKRETLISIPNVLDELNKTLTLEW